jgi:hypothetical protein
MALGVRLEVIHVPGKHMIAQRTDGLSRGIRIGSGLPPRTPQQETLRVFQPVPPTQNVVTWVTSQTQSFRSHPLLQYKESDRRWGFADVVGRATLWLPAPEWAHQLIDMVLNAWVEQPWDTEAFVLVPRVFQRDWGRVSKHVVELRTHPAAMVPDYGPTTDIPCVLLHLPCYVRSFPPLRRMDTSPGPPGGEWHREQAEHVRGLS